MLSHLLSALVTSIAYKIDKSQMIWKILTASEKCLLGNQGEQGSNQRGAREALSPGKICSCRFCKDVIFSDNCALAQMSIKIMLKHNCLALPPTKLPGYGPEGERQKFAYSS